MIDKTRRAAARAAKRVEVDRSRPTRTVYGLFEAFEAAEAALRALREAGYATESASLIVQAAAKHRLGIRARVKEPSKTTGRRGRAAPPDLAQLIARQHPILVPEAGPLYAANQMATGLVHAASAENPAMAEAGLRAALEATGVAEHYAQAYQAGVKAGWLLLMLSVPDERAFEAAKILDQHGGRETFIFITA